MDEPRPSTTWQNVTKDPKVLLTVGGLLAFLILNLIYGRFYNNLGVDPRDIGLDYIATLVKSIQLLVGVVGYSFVVMSAVYLGFFMLANGYTLLRRRPSAYSFRDLRSWIPTIVVFISLGTVVALLIVADQAYKDAKEVKNGRPLTYIRIGPFLMEAPVRADPAFIEPIATTGSTPPKSSTPSSSTKKSDAANNTNTNAIHALRGRMLIYLGQTNSILVLYDGTIDQAIHVPASQVVLRVGHCEDQESPSPGCDNAY